MTRWPRVGRRFSKNFQSYISFLPHQWPAFNSNLWFSHGRIRLSFYETLVIFHSSLEELALLTEFSTTFLGFFPHLMKFQDLSIESKLNSVESHDSRISSTLQIYKLDGKILHRSLSKSLRTKLTNFSVSHCNSAFQVFKRWILFGSLI